jgi:hypothetical protein
MNNTLLQYLDICRLFLIQQTHQWPFRQVGDNQIGYSDFKKSEKSVVTGLPLNQCYSLYQVISEASSAGMLYQLANGLNPS